VSGAGEPPVLDPRGAAFFPDSGVLAVADLHVGYEAAERARGIALPRLELDVLTPLLDALLDEHRPDVVVVNGDFKHAFKRHVPEEARAVHAVWRRLSERARVVVIEGNHDARIRDILPDAEVATSHRAGGRVFTHGHLAKHVPVEPGDGLVLGHEHPALTLRDAVGASTRVRAFLRRDARPPRARAVGRGLRRAAERPVHEPPPRAPGPRRLPRARARGRRGARLRRGAPPEADPALNRRRREDLTMWRWRARPIGRLMKTWEARRARALATYRN